jgi:hypothetical protein
MSSPTLAPPPRPAAATRGRALRANLRQAYDLALTGALGALFGLYLFVESVQAESTYVRGALAGLLIGVSLGVFLNAYGPIRDGAWIRLGRGVTLGAPAAAVGGALGVVVGEVVIGAFQGGLLGRAFSWAVLGMGVGIGQGIADRSRDRLFFGLIGGGLGGFLGGFLFEGLRLLMGHRPDVGQVLGIVLLGAGLGLCLALVEQALRRAWVQVLNGRQEGRIYLLSHGRSRMGLDERAEVGIFGDPQVSRRHAEVESTASGFVLHDLAGIGTTRVNGDVLTGDRVLGDGDRIELGRTMLIFRQR